MVKRITITVSESSISAAQTAIEDSELRGWLRNIFSDASIYTEDIEDPDEIDSEGNFTGTVAGIVIRAILDDHVFSRAKSILTNAGVSFNAAETESPSLILEEDDTDGHLGNLNFRRPGRRYKAFGTFKATGTKPSQIINTSGKEINQWNDVVYLRNMGKNPPKDAVIFKVGDYKVNLKRLIYDTELALGVTWTFQATVNNTPTGDTKQSNNGSVSGSVTLANLAVNDEISIATAPDVNGSEFKVLSAKIQIARL